MLNAPFPLDLAQLASGPIMNLVNAIKQNLRPVIKLAGPVVAAELAWMFMGVIDTIMIGRVDALSIGAVSLGHAIFFAVAVFGIGLLLGLDYFISRDFGAGDHRGCRETLIQSFYLCTAITPFLMGLLYFSPEAMKLFGIEVALADEMNLYLNGVTASLWPLLIYTALRRYLQAMEQAHLIMWVVIAANFLNLVADWALIFGHLGFPALGAEGAGWATFTSRVFLVLSLVFIVWRLEGHAWLEKLRWRPDLQRLKAMIALGLPSALQMGLEVGVFSSVTALAGRVGAESLAAHQIALMVTSATFMIPMGISSAGAVRVGQALGRHDYDKGIGAGWASLAMGTSCMIFSATTLWLFGAPIARLFTDQLQLIPLGATLLSIAALFQLVDAIQVITTGILRGLGDTRSPLIANLIGHWLIGLPTGCLLAFHFEMGVKGLWIGLCVGLTLVAIPLLMVWHIKTKRLYQRQ